MHIINKKIKSDKCLICFEPLLKDFSIFHAIEAIPICRHCINQLEIIEYTLNFYHHKLTILYQYNDFFRGLLYQYKGQYDYALKDVFLCLYKQIFRKKFKDYTIVIAPSSKEDNEIRGYAPMEEIAKTISSNVFTGLYKKENYKQSELSFTDRSSVNNKISIINKDDLKGKKILIMDDVLTSGSTLKCCLDIVLSCNPQNIELLVLSTKQNLKELEDRVNNL